MQNFYANFKLVEGGVKTAKGCKTKTLLLYGYAYSIPVPPEISKDYRWPCQWVGQYRTQRRRVITVGSKSSPDV